MQQYAKPKVPDAKQMAEMTRDTGTRKCCHRCAEATSSQCLPLQAEQLVETMATVLLELPALGWACELCHSRSVINRYVDIFIFFNAKSTTEVISG